jgi:hypothetical protein
MLLLTYKRDLLSTDPHGSGKPIGFQTQREQRNILLPTTWLGKDFRAKGTATPSGSGGSHASPQAHWRRGHWHTVRYGEGRLQRRVDWFQPVYVNASTTTTRK